MMAADFTIKEDDTAPSIEATLKDDDGVAVDINGATIKFIMSQGGTAKVNAAANNDQVGDGSDGTKGMVSYDWTTANTDTPGKYDGEWQVIYTNGKKETFPSDRYLDIRVLADLGD